MTAQELIECVKAMSDGERQELADILMPNFLNASTDLPSRPRPMSGLEFNQHWHMNATPEQREWLRLTTLCASTVDTTILHDR